MVLHLPYSERPEDEFQMPDGSWHYTLKAVVQDSWLFWKHALPAEPELRQLLDDEAVTGITELATAIHLAHQRFANYRDLDDSPFTVGQWWDPSDSTGDWSSGQRVLLRIQGRSAEDLLHGLRGRGQLQGVVISDRWAELRLRHHPRPPALESA